MILCKCGCKNTLKQKTDRRYYISEYINGHYWNNKHQSIQTINKRIKRGKDHYNYKDGHCLIKYYCIDCGKELVKIGAKRCKKCSDISQERREKLSKSISAVMGGTGYSKHLTEYGLEFDSSIKEQVRCRDKYKCQICGCSQLENGRQLSVHHIDYNKKNSKLNNLISLCRNCHLGTNYDREYWMKYFQNKNII